MKKIFQKVLSITLVVTMVTAMMPKLTAYAENLRPLSVGAQFTGDDGYVYTVTSVGDQKEAKFTVAIASGVLTIPSVTSYDDVTYHVTAVGDYALYNQTILTGLTISSGVTAIGDKAFYNCTNLESVSIADSVKSIGEQAFYNCGIKELQLGNGISQLGTWAFFGCKNLKSVVLPDSLTTCGSSIFRECTALESINIPSGLTAINTEMLMGTSIESITLPESITSVGMYTLSFYPKLKSITFLGNLQKIDQDAFSNDPLLKTIVFKSAAPPTTINTGGIFFSDTYPIYGQVPSGSVEAYQSVFSSAYYFPYQIKFGDQPPRLCVGETFVAQNSGTVISYKVTSVSPATVEVAAGSPAYSGSVIIPGSVKGSDGYTYQVTGIGSGAFSGCEGLTSAVLPSGVATVDNQAFSDCAALTSLTFEGSAPQTVGNNLFQGDSVPLTVHVPANEKPNYEAAFTAYHDELTFVAATLPALSIPSGLSWDGTTAKWGAVTGASGYTVTLYKDSEAVVTKNVGADTVSYNFENETSGNGNYTFTVTAQGNGSTSSDSAASEASTTYTGGTSPSGTISMFSLLDNSVKTRSVAFGTAKSALNLPTSLSAKVNGSETSISGVTWSSNPVYDGSAAGTYTFTSVLPSGYTLSGSAALPTVTVTVKLQSGDNTGSSVSVSGFESLSSAVKNQTVAIGTAIASLNLPQKIKVVVDGISGLWVRVSNWVCNISNSSIFSQTGTYTFIPMLDKTYHDSGYVDSGYTLANGVTPPNITVTVQGSSSNNHSRDPSSSSSSPATSPQTASTQVDTASNTATVTTVPDSITNISGTAQISVTVPSVTGGTGGSLDTGKTGKVTISLPESAIVQQLNANQNVDLTLSVPSSVAQQTNSNTSVDIPVGSDVFAAAKTGETDLVINIKDADTHKLAYTWTFKGADLAKSTTAVTDVNIGMAIRLTTEVPKVNQLTPNNTGLVLMFDHSGVLPSMASLTFSAKEKGFKPEQKLYFYFYNTSLGQLEPQVQEYTVDANGNVMVQISHCSNYVLLPNKARTITLDTRVYTMPVGSSYVTGVKLAGVSGAKLKTYSSTKGVADVRVLKNGNVMATGKKAGMTYVMIDVYDNKNKFLTHASVRLTVKEIVKPNGNSARQFGIF